MHRTGRKHVGIVEYYAYISSLGTFAQVLKIASSNCFLVFGRFQFITFFLYNRTCQTIFRPELCEGYEVLSIPLFKITTNSAVIFEFLSYDMGHLTVEMKRCFHSYKFSE